MRWLIAVTGVMLACGASTIVGVGQERSGNQTVDRVAPFDRLNGPRIDVLEDAQGFVPAILTREILLRRTALVPGRWCAFLVVSVCLAFSAAYEIFEWWTAVAIGASAEAFLGTQGDPWDTQWDMCLALLGALTALALLSRIHAAQLARLASRQ